MRPIAIDRRRSIALVLVALIAALLPLIAASPARAAAPGDIVINEIMQNPSAVSDTNGEYFEVFNTTGSAIDIDGWTIEDDDGDSHVIGSSVIVPAGGYAVLARNANSAANGGFTADYQYSGFFLENGADEIALLDGTTEIDRVDYDGGPNWPDPSGASMELEDTSLDNNVGANWCYSSTTFGAGDKGTPGSANSDCDIVPIYDIQGGNHLSPFDGVRVVTEGVVTAVDFSGFYVQDAAGDDDDHTSDGMFVFNGGSLKPAIGDSIRLQDFVTEFIPFGNEPSITEMAFPALQILSNGNPLPTPSIIGRGGRVPPNVLVVSEEPVDLQVMNAPVFNPDVDGIDFYESLEGMLVTIEDAVAVSATRTFNSFSSELFTLANNGADVAPNDARTKRKGIELQPDPDNRGDQNPERVQVQFDSDIYPGSVPALTVGDRLGDVTGVVGYSFGNYEVNATQVVTPIAAGLGKETTKLDNKQNHVTVASYNVLNLAAVSSDDNQRTTLADQIVNNLGNPDVIALQEIQDNNGSANPNPDGVLEADETMQELVDAIVLAGGPEYEFCDVAPTVHGETGGVPGGNIRNAFFWNADRVENTSGCSIIDVAAFTGTRRPLVSTFEFNDVEFTVINNHLSSRFGSDPIFGAIQPFFQAGEVEREAQTTALNTAVDAMLASGADRIAVVGDLNTMQWTNDLTEILPGTGANLVLTNLINQLNDDNVYTFIFDGNSQALDHFFVTDALLPAKFDIVHVNVDFPRVDDTVGSDHEPLLARLNIGNQGNNNG